MFKMLFLALPALITLNSTAQQNFSQQIKIYSQDYQEKSRKQKKTGNVLVMTGLGLVIVGAVYPKGDFVDRGPACPLYCTENYKNDDIKTAFIVAGVASAVASVPFYIAARKNRKRAAAVAVKIHRGQYVLSGASINLIFNL